ncbi:MAG: cyclomaltodextrinase [Ileibacterium sp.]|nr:cyclomaltodextrinase [Ileibacterium sp.]
MWFDESIIYQIYPLGAFGAPFENDGKLQHRILKMEEWISPLKKLGVNAVLFNPLLESSTHGYTTRDMRKVDVRLGDNDDLKKISKELHDNQIRLIFDAVFNHVGREFAPFMDVLENRENSRYKDWFHVDFGGNNSYNDGLWYEGWEGHEELVKLNLDNPEVVQYLLDTVDFWIDEFQVDGLRLDVAYSLNRNFLRALRNHVKARDPEFLLIGEMIHGDCKTIVNPEMLDSATNYECYKGIYSSLNSKNFYEILYSFNRQFGKDPWCLYTGMNLMNFVDNHDVTRIASILEKPQLLKPAYTLLMTMPGVPCIYYGSEWGIQGRKEQGDNALRPALEKLEENELTDFLAKLIEIRKEHPALQKGDYTQIAINNEYCIYQRAWQNERIWTCINISDQPGTLYVNEAGKGKDLLSHKEVVFDHQFVIPPQTCMVLEME